MRFPMRSCRGPCGVCTGCARPIIRSGAWPWPPRGRISGSLGARLELWCGQEWAVRELPGSLLEALRVEPDDFWSWHWTLNSPRFPKPHPLLGETRVTDLAVNVVLPWLWVRAVEGKNQEVQRLLEQHYLDWPSAEDNSVLRLARERLLGGAAQKAVPGAAAQQGLIQIVRDFCDHSTATCENCKMPELVRDFVSREFKFEPRLPNLNS